MAKYTKHALNMLMPVLGLAGVVEPKACRTILGYAYDYVVNRRWKVGVDTLQHYCTDGSVSLKPIERDAVTSRPVLSAILDVAMALKPFEDGSYEAAKVSPAEPKAPRPDPFKPGFKKHKGGRRLKFGPRTPPKVSTAK